MKGKSPSRLLSEASEFLGDRRERADARLSAEVLLAHVLGIDRTSLFREIERPVELEREREFRSLVERRRKGEPVAYLVGEKEFFSLSFHVDRSVLIPRPETELLVDLVLERFRGRRGGRLIDVGTGSGAIAVTLKKRLPFLEVIGSDRSPESLVVARKNADRHGVEIRWVQSDLLKDVDGGFDAIVANLPYIPTEDVPHLSVSVRDYEPHLALNGGRNGLELIERAAIEARERLLPKGWLFLEVGNAQEENVRNLLQTTGFEIESIRDDYQGIPRAVVARRG